MSTPIKALIAIVALALAGVGSYWWWQHQARPAPVAQAPSEPIAAPPAPASVPASAPPAIRHPIEAASAPADTGPLPSLADSDQTVGNALIALLGRKDVQTFLQLDGFVRRAVATVDNLGRHQAAARLWPVVPTAGRFTVTESAAGIVLSDANARRYTHFVRFATSIDASKAAAMYVRLYPLFQSAYEELGYPGRHFNDRLVDVIDLLLQTPEPTAPLKLTLTEVQGPVASERPWVRYEYDDATLESRPAGQKILLRMGITNEQLLKAKLREYRALIAKS